MNENIWVGIFFNQKINRKIENYRSCPLKYENGESFIAYVWCTQTTLLFASGMVDGYFGNEIPVEFWDLLALYISINTLSSLPWAIPFGQEEIDVMIKLAEDVY